MGTHSRIIALLSVLLFWGNFAEANRWRFGGSARASGACTSCGQRTQMSSSNFSTFIPSSGSACTTCGGGMRSRSSSFAGGCANGACGSDGGGVIRQNGRLVVPVRPGLVSVTVDGEVSQKPQGATGYYLQNGKIKWVVNGAAAEEATPESAGSAEEGVPPPPTEPEPIPYSPRTNPPATAHSTGTASDSADPVGGRQTRPEYAAPQELTPAPGEPSLPAPRVREAEKAPALPALPALPEVGQYKKIGQSGVSSPKAGTFTVCYEPDGTCKTGNAEFAKQELIANRAKAAELVNRGLQQTASLFNRNQSAERNAQQETVQALETKHRARRHNLKAISDSLNGQKSWKEVLEEIETREADFASDASAILRTAKIPDAEKAILAAHYASKRGAETDEMLAKLQTEFLPNTKSASILKAFRAGARDYFLHTVQSNLNRKPEDLAYDTGCTTCTPFGSLHETLTAAPKTPSASARPGTSVRVESHSRAEVPPPDPTNPKIKFAPIKLYVYGNLHGYSGGICGNCVSLNNDMNREWGGEQVRYQNGKTGTQMKRLSDGSFVTKHGMRVYKFEASQSMGVRIPVYSNGRTVTVDPFAGGWPNVFMEGPDGRIVQLRGGINAIERAAEARVEQPAKKRVAGR